MRFGPFHLAILVGSILLLLPAGAQNAQGDGLVRPPEPERFLFLDTPDGAGATAEFSAMAPARFRGLEDTGERRLRNEGGLVDRDFRSGRGRSLGLGAVLGNRHPTAFDRYIDELENRIRSARRKLDG